jgi:predicted component of viral defense system (DUF524 family)
VTDEAVVQAFVDGEQAGYQLRISALPGKFGPISKSYDGSAQTVVQLMEGEEYLYVWEGPSGALTTEPSELFRPDRKEGRAGRIRAGLSVGFISVTLSSRGDLVGSCELEVRPRKLTYEDEYKWMLRDIAGEMTELLMERFAASDLRFSVDPQREAATLYQRFEFLRALIDGDDFRSAMQEILHRPHSGWVTIASPVNLGRGLQSAAHVSRQLTRLGIDSREGLLRAGKGRPPPIFQQRTEATHDTIPNRFVRHAFRHWLSLLFELEAALRQQQLTAPVARGIAEVGQVISVVEQFLTNDLLVELPELDRFPSDDQVLQKRQGYREVFRAYLEFELGALLNWTDSSFSAGTRNVAATYEYWAFLQLAKCVASIAGVTFSLEELLRVDASGLTVHMKKGVERVFAGLAERNGRKMSIELWFNKSYGVPEGSWSRTMRPDYSLLIQPESRDKPFEVVLVHFDAKYRVQFLRNVLAATADLDEDDPSIEQALARGEATSADLLKMHAYRDAIRQTAGAYVLYPGGDAEVGRAPLSEFRELLPGLGAFVLRPSDGGQVLGIGELQHFVEQVLEHSSLRLTQHERGRYWADVVYGSGEPPSDDYRGSPPGEATVLLGFVKSERHWRWIEKTSSYNVRVLGREGGVTAEATLFNAQLLLLYCPSTQKLALARVVSGPEQLSALQMRATGYPQPGGPAYWCVQLSWVRHPEWFSGITCDAIVTRARSSGSEFGAPIVLRWKELASAS